MGTSATILSARTYLPKPRGTRRSGITFMRQDSSIALRVSNRYIEAMRASERETLVGEGVELRRHDRTNYPLYARWYGDEEIWRLTSWAAQPLTRAEVERLFEDREGSSVNDSFAIHREGEEEPLGVISLVNINEANDSAEL